MYSLAFLALVLCIALPVESETPDSTGSSSSITYSEGDIRNCHLSVNDGLMYRMEVLPGGGFDNLRNLDMGQVYAYTYKDCQISLDGKYLLPDNAFLTPLQKSKTAYFSEVIDHWDDYTDLTSSSINIEGSFTAIHGKFSTGYKNLKTQQVNKKAKSTRSQVRHSLYTVKLRPGSPLHPRFKSALYEIAGHIQNNNTAYAHYLAELLVGDYGTHYTTSVEAGAVLAKVDYLNEAYFNDHSEQSNELSASAGSSFFGGNASFGINFSHQSSETDQHNYSSQIVQTEVISHGGPPIPPTGFSMEDWEKEVPHALVAVDKVGKPLYYAINPEALVELPFIIIFRVSEMVEQAIDSYYSANTYRGCTDPGNKNFDFQANLADDGFCEGSPKNFTFGGVYQVCTVISSDTKNLCTQGSQPKLQRNGLTKGLSCPSGYIAVKLQEGFASEPDTKEYCEEDCTFYFFSCHDKCHPTKAFNRVNYETYWCAQSESVSPESGYLFGGFYTSTTVNPLTGNKGCPQFFHSLKILDDTNVCVSTDYELGAQYAVDFGGFFSCSTGNPLAAQNRSAPEHWPRHCPQGSAQHLVTVDQSCEINFCVSVGTFSSESLIPVKTLPLGKRPDFPANVTDTLVVSGHHELVWVRNGSGEWMQHINEDPLPQKSSQGISTVGIVFLTMFLTVFAMLVAVIVVWLSRKFYRKRKHKEFK